MITVPELHLDITKGIGKMSRDGKIRVTIGGGSGPRAFDLSFVHIIELDDEADAIEHWLPGTVGTRAGALGSMGDGNRALTWKCKAWDATLLLLPRGETDESKAFYNGPASVVRAAFKCSEKAAVLTVFLRLHEVYPATMDALTPLLNTDIEYRLTRTKLGGGVSSASNTPLFSAAPIDELKVGDIAIGVVGDQEVVGIVSVVHDGKVSLWQDLDSTRAAEVPRDQISAWHHLTGAKGGDAYPAIRKLLAKAGRVVSAGELLDALEQDPLGADNTWAITKRVVDTVLGQADQLPEEV